MINTSTRLGSSICRSPAQVYPQPSDMPDLREWLERDARKCAARDVGLLTVGLLAGTLLGMTF